MKEEILSKEVVFDDYLKVEKWYFRFEKDDGGLTKPVDRMQLKRTDSAAIIIYNTDTEEVLLIRQFRHATYEKGPGWIIEAVAGVIDEHEEPQQAVEREAIEETGYKVYNVEHIATVFASPGYTTERMFIYYGETTNANRVAEGGGLDEENEYITTVTYTIDELADALANNQLNDSKTVIAAYYLLKKHNR